MNDWQDDIPIGEIHDGAAAWCETALLMTYTELPGLYVRPDDGFYKMIDNMDITQVKKTKGKLLISVKNPTNYPGKLKIFSEKKADLNKPLDELYLYNCRQELINAGETKVFSFKY
jgi:hypothetical protein